MWFGAGSPPVTACQNVTGWPSTISGCSISSSTRTAGTSAAANQRATQSSRRTRGRRSAERPILTTIGALASPKIAFSPIRRSSAPSLSSPARWHASRSTGSAAEEENSAAASGTRPRIPRLPGAVKRVTLPEGKPVPGAGNWMPGRPASWVGSAAMDVIGKDVVVVGLGAFGSAALWRLTPLSRSCGENGNPSD